MSDQMKELADVQSRDLEIDSLHEERGHTPQDLTDAVNRLEQLQSLLEAKRREQEQRNSEVRAAELELGSMVERRKAAANSALTAATPKEASQFQNQELMFATRVQEVEEDLMPLLEDAERLQAEVSELTGQVEELAPKVEELKQVEADRVQAVDERIESLVSERAGMIGGIDDSLLATYEQVRKARKGVGLAEVVGGSRCSGCNVHLPIHVVQKVRKDSAVVRCPSCGRILYYPA